MNRGVCEDPDCPYSHDETFLKMTKEWREFGIGLAEKKRGLSSAAFDGEAEAGRGAIVVLRAAMPSASSAKKSSLKGKGQLGSVRKPQKL